MTPEAVGHDDSEAAGNDNATDDKSKAAAKPSVWKKPQKKKAGKKQVGGCGKKGLDILKVWTLRDFCDQMPLENRSCIIS